ncbi:unnamed protein product [Caenorhabditis auriculariae]|uniref:PHD-type domain-containing protein n=1 Tax=Caenorhabditis auriculariae TaxID=2777116 RepID=A0A8S1GZM6_9PELO|nr:unnamed protein product [Caenorhabditis auriculariae]
MSASYPTPPNGAAPYTPTGSYPPPQYGYPGMDQYGQNPYPSTSIGYPPMQSNAGGAPKPQTGQAAAPAPPAGYDPRTNGYMGYPGQNQNGSLMPPPPLMSPSGNPMQSGYPQHQPMRQNYPLPNPYQQTANPIQQPPTTMPTSHMMQNASTSANSQMHHQVQQVQQQQQPPNLSAQQMQRNAMQQQQNSMSQMMQQNHNHMAQAMNYGQMPNAQLPQQPQHQPQQQQVQSQPLAPQHNPKRPASGGQQQLPGRSPMNHMMRQQSDGSLLSPHANGTYHPQTARQNSQPSLHSPGMQQHLQMTQQQQHHVQQQQQMAQQQHLAQPHHQQHSAMAAQQQQQQAVSNQPGSMGPPMIPPNAQTTTFSKPPTQQQLQSMQKHQGMVIGPTGSGPSSVDYATNSSAPSPRFPDRMPSPPRFDTPFTSVTHYDMPPAHYQAQETFKRINPQLQRYFQRTKQPLRLPYPRPTQIAPPVEPPTFGFLRDTKYFELRFERRAANHMPPPPAPLNRSQSMQSQIMSPTYSNSPGPMKPATKKARSASDSDEAFNALSLQQNMMNQQMMNDQQQRLAMPQYMMEQQQMQQQPQYNNGGMPQQHRNMVPQNGYMMQQMNDPNARRQSYQPQQNGVPMDMNQMAGRREFMPPLELRCTQCSHPIAPGAQAMHCMYDHCKNVFHKECTGLLPEAFARLEGEHAQVRWTCNQCTIAAGQR